MSEDAISRFEKLVAEPEMDHSRLAGLLSWYMRETRSRKQQRNAESLSDRLNSWLHITDRKSREAFLLNDSTRRAVINLLHREGREAILWTWLRLVYERQLIQAEVTSAEWLKVEDHLVSGIMRLSIRKNDINDAAQQFLEACRYRHESGRGERPMTTSGKRLASAIIFHRHKHGIDSTLYGDLLQYLPSPSMCSDLNSAYCAIYHPKTPTAKHLYAVLKHEHHSLTLSKGLVNNTPQFRKAIMIAMLDAVKVALDEGKSKQASYILDFAVASFPEYLPARRTEEPEPEIERYLDLIPG